METISLLFQISAFSSIIFLSLLLGLNRVPISGTNILLMVITMFSLITNGICMGLSIGYLK